MTQPHPASDASIITLDPDKVFALARQTRGTGIEAQIVRSRPFALLGGVAKGYCSHNRGRGHNAGGFSSSPTRTHPSQTDGTLKFDDTGLFCMAGIKTGNIHVLEASDNANLRFKFRLTVARGAITCITFVPSQTPGRNPMLLVNSCDSTVSILDCMYPPTPGVLISLQMKHRVKVAHSLLPLRCCYSGFGGGYLISASEDKEVYVYALQKEAHYKSVYLSYHRDEHVRLPPRQCGLDGVDRDVETV